MQQTVGTIIMHGHGDTILVKKLQPPSRPLNGAYPLSRPPTRRSVLRSYIGPSLPCSLRMTRGVRLPEHDQLMETGADTRSNMASIPLGSRRASKLITSYRDGSVLPDSPAIPSISSVS